MIALILEVIFHFFAVLAFAILTVMSSTTITFFQIMCVVNVIIWSMIFGLDIIRIAIKIMNKKKSKDDIK